MPRRRASSPEETVELYGDMSMPSAASLQAQGDETRARLLASIRPDMAGDPINLTMVPQTYQQRVMRMWDHYTTDPLFKRLIDRVVDFNANGSQWEIPTDDQETSWITRLLKRIGMDSRDKRLEREEEFWNTWSQQLNQGVPNVLPGLDQITAWATRHLLLSGMFVPHWQLGTMRLGKQTYVVPTTLTCYPASSITLRRDNSLFLNESVLYFKPINYATTMMEGQFIEAPTFMPKKGIPINMVQLAPISDFAESGWTESFCVKYNWSPGDIVSIRRGQIQMTGAGVYPIPPFFGLLPQFMLRQKMFHADLATLDGIINFIMMYKIGDKDHPPKAPEYRSDGTVVKDGTIAQVRKLIQSGRMGPAMELFVPYYVDLVIKQPDPAVLLSDTKYGSSATEIMAAFGIMYARTAAGSRERFQDLNTAGFEEFVGGIRTQIRVFWEMMASHIIALNRSKLIGVRPSWSPNPLNTKTDAFRAELVKLKGMGTVSLKTLLRYHGLDDAVELRRIAQELETDVDDMTNENVPLTYVQQTIQPDAGGVKDRNPLSEKSSPRGKMPSAAPSSNGAPPPAPSPVRQAKVRKQTEISKTRQPGRPPGKATP